MMAPFTMGSGGTICKMAMGPRSFLIRVCIKDTGKMVNIMEKVCTGTQTEMYMMVTGYWAYATGLVHYFVRMIKACMRVNGYAMRRMASEKKLFLMDLHLKDCTQPRKKTLSILIIKMMMV